MTSDLAILAVFIGTVVGTALSVVLARLLIDPKIRAIEEKLSILLDLLISNERPSP